MQKKPTTKERQGQLPNPFVIAKGARDRKAIWETLAAAQMPEASA